MQVASIHPTKRSITVQAIDDMGVAVPLGSVTIPANYPIPSVATLVEVEYLYVVKSLVQPIYRGQRHAIHPRLIAAFDRLKAVGLPCLVDRHAAAADLRRHYPVLEFDVFWYRRVVREERVALDAVHRQQPLVEFFLVEPQHRLDGAGLPRGEADLSRREVRVVRLQQRDRHAEHGGDLLDDLFAAAEILGRERQRNDLDVAADGHEASGTRRTTQLAVDLGLEPVERIAARAGLHDHCVVGPGVILERREVELMHGFVLLHDAPASLHLAETVVEVAGIRVSPVADLVGRKKPLLVVPHAVGVALDELARVRLAGDHVHPLRGHRPQLGRPAEHRVRDRVQVRVAGQLEVEEPKLGQVVAVHPRVARPQQPQDRVLLGDLLEVVVELDHLATHRRTGPLDDPPLACTRHRPRIPQRSNPLLANVQPQRGAGRRLGVELRRRIDPRPKQPHGRLIGVRLRLSAVRTSEFVDADGRLQEPLAGEL